MVHPRFSSLSLRARIAATMAVVLLPLAVTAVWAVVTLNRTVGDFDRLITQSALRLDATIRLQYRVLNTGTVVAHERLPAEARRVSLNREVRAVEDVFRKLLEDRTLQPRERRIVEHARHEWRSELARPGTAAVSATGLHGQAAYLLGTLADAYRLESATLRRQLERSKQRLLWIIAAAAFGCLVIAALGTAVLARSVLRPLHALKKGIARFADNDLAYRLPGGQPGEFSQLAHEINRMAEHLEAHKTELEQLSTRDPLTGLFNRREFSQRLQAERERGRRYGKSFSLLMVDIDHFKRINDRYGHPAGDEALTTIADLLRLNVRPMDVVARHGGEEFAILLPETDVHGAWSLAERIRSAIADSTLLINDEQPLSLTVSIGLAAFAGGPPNDVDPVAVADQALYRAKQDGRNRVVASDTPPTQA